MLAMLVAAEGPAYEAGVVVGRLLFLALGIALIVAGRRRRRDPATPSRGTALIVVGIVVLVLGVLGALASAANTAGTA